MNPVAVDQAVVILRSPIQSAGLHARNIAAPPELLHTDVRNVALMKSRKRVADTYMDSLTIERGRFPRSISLNDYSEAQRYSVGIYVADLLPDLISSAVNLIQGNEVMQAINNLQQANQLTIQAITNLQLTMQAIQLTMQANQLTMQATLRTMEVKICNSSAHEVDDVIVPPQMGEAIPPLEFPRTIRELIALTPGQLMTAIEQYYGLPHEGDAMAVRISRIRRAYNVGIIMMDREEMVTRRVAI